jgi:thiamine kinase-like enzyme
MGIFHADLKFNNTIILGNKSKIIDFDYAFKVKLCDGEDET